ncbi:MAG: DUF2617 family protein [Planctomycetota bacterium]
MNSTAQTSQIQTHQISLYERALHPELFSMRGRRVVQQGPYETELWVLRGGHVIRFEIRGGCYCEVVHDDSTSVPRQGQVTSMPCGMESDYDTQFKSPPVGYMTTVQSEQLSENLYAATFDEMQDYASDVEALSHAWEDEAGQHCSLLDVQRFSKEVHVQSYHLSARGGTVLRTQTIFECR